MPSPSCPACDGESAHLLDEIIKEALVRYYRCDRCGHVWAVDKGDGHTVTHVTPLCSYSLMYPLLACTSTSLRLTLTRT